MLTGTLRSLFATVENYPDLKSNQNVLDLQEQLTTTENQISFARQHYNASVLDYNSAIATFPNVLVAGPFGFDTREFFDAEPAASQVPDVDLGFGSDERRRLAAADRRCARHRDRLRRRLATAHHRRCARHRDRLRRRPATSRHPARLGRAEADRVAQAASRRPRRVHMT